jgi:hypothetical protein
MAKRALKKKIRAWLLAIVWIRAIGYWLLAIKNHN